MSGKITAVDLGKEKPVGSKKSIGLVSLKREDLVKMDDLKPQSLPKPKRKTAASHLEGKSSKKNILEETSRKATTSSKSSSPAKLRITTVKTLSSKLDGTIKSKDTGNSSLVKKKVVKKKKKKATGEKSVDISKASISKKSKDKSLSKDPADDGSKTSPKLKVVKTIKSTEKSEKLDVSKASKSGEAIKKKSISKSKESKPKNIALKAPETDATQDIEPPFYSPSGLVGKPPKDPFSSIASKDNTSRDNYTGVAQKNNLTPSRDSAGSPEKSFGLHQEGNTNLSFREKDHFRTSGSKRFNQTTPLDPIQELIDPRISEARRTLDSKASRETDFRATFAKERRQIKDIYQNFKHAIHEKELEHISRLAENYHGFLTEMKREFDQAEMSLNLAKYEANNCWVENKFSGQDSINRATLIGQQLTEDRHLSKLLNSDYEARYKEAQDPVFEEIAEIDAFLKSKKSNLSYVYGIRRDSHRESNRSSRRQPFSGIGLTLEAAKPSSCSYNNRPQSTSSLNSMRQSRCVGTQYYPASSSKPNHYVAKYYQPDPIQNLDTLLNSLPRSGLKERDFDSTTPSQSRKLMRSMTNCNSAVRGKIGDLLQKQEREFDLKKKSRPGPRAIF